MRVASIRRMDISNGPGIRVSIFTQGCNTHCDGCFNPETWDYSKGDLWNEEQEQLVLNLCSRNSVKGLSILGGEPLSSQNYPDLNNLLCKFKEQFPNKTIWMWTGKTYETLTEEDKQVLKFVDVLVDGPFKIDLQDFKLKYRGSANQRVIDVQQSLMKHKVVCKEVN